jgi:hypothetical protein
MMQKDRKRKILIVENLSIFAATLAFAKLVIFNHYKRFNVPIKLLFTMGYTVILDPLTILSGYYANQVLEARESSNKMDII